MAQRPIRPPLPQNHVPPEVVVPQEVVVPPEVLIPPAIDPNPDIAVPGPVHPPQAQRLEVLCFIKLACSVSRSLICLI
jgi:hypothetical protein